MDNDEVKELGKFLEESLSKEQLTELIEIAHRLSVLDAVVTTGGCNIDTVARQMYFDKDCCVPFDHMKDIVIEQLPHLIFDGMVADGKATEEGTNVSMHHMMMLNEGRRPQ